MMIKNKGRFLIFSMLLLMSVLVTENAHAQRYQNKDNKPLANTEKSDDSDSGKSKFHISDKLVFGGSLGLQLGNVTYIDVSPLVGYKIKPNFQVGGGISYIYLGVKDFYGKYSTNLYGGRLYSQYSFPESEVIPFISNIFVYGEYQMMNVEDMRYYNPVNPVRKWIGSPLVGGGIRSQIGRRSYYNLMVLYNLNYDRNNEISAFYNSPLVIRASIML